MNFGGSMNGKISPFKAILIFAAFFSAALSSCKFQPNVDLENSSRYGSLSVVQGDDGRSSRAVLVSEIEKADVSVSGRGMETLTKTDVTVSSGAGSVTFDGIPVGKNRIVTIEAKKTIGSILKKIDGTVMRAVTDIGAGVNSVAVSWSTTAVGNVYAKLLSEGYDIEKLSMNAVSDLIPAGVHSALVDVDAVSDTIKNGTVHSSYELHPASVSFTSDVPLSSMTVQVSDPSSAIVSGLTGSLQSVSGVAPGKWNFYILDGSQTVIYSESVELASGGSFQINGGNRIVLKAPSPRLEDQNGNAISTFLSSPKTVYLSARTYDGESPLSGASIYYTTDGTEPSGSGVLYTGSGISVSVGTVLKAVTVKEGLVSSDAKTWTFTEPSLGNQHPAGGTYAKLEVDASSPVGAHIRADGNATFALYSKNATKVLLEIYSSAYGEALPLYDYWLEKDGDNFWRATVQALPAGAIYAFRLWGPNWTFSEAWRRGGSSEGFVSDVDSNGNRFNPNKVVFDPYAYELTHDKSDPVVLSHGGTAKTSAIYSSGEANRNFDTAAYAPKAYVIDDATDFGSKPGIPSAAARIYEAHVRGITKHPSSSSLSSILSGFDGFEDVADVPAEYRGTYKGAAYLAPYLKALGINTIELLPVHESDNDGNPDDSAGGNYWAYMTYGYFAPDRRYSYDKSAGGPTREFKQMVKAFHDEGLEVYLDVVYNHSGEGGTWRGSSDSYRQAEITFMRGIDNATYYCLTGTGKEQYWETSGCGNNLQCDNSTVRNLILDSLEYWITKMGVDGFRFDLAPVLGRVNNGSGWGTFDSSAKTLTDVASLGTARNVEMIAEAWDCSWPSGYQIGSFPTGWGDWNGVYRDVVRKFVSGSGTSETKMDGGNTLYHLSIGDAIYGKNGSTSSSPLAKFGVSVNMVVAHDGFTLADLSSYVGIGNALNGTLTWPFGPSDGGNGDYNYLVEDSPLGRRRTARNYIALQMFTRGIPMIVWGDEFGRTQNGNNNPYNIDSVATWNNYSMINTKGPHKVSTGGGGSYVDKFGDFSNTEDKNGNFVFMKRMLDMHGDEAFRQLSHTAATTTYISSGDERAFGYATDGSSFSGGHKFIMFTNQTSGEKPFTVPAPASGKKWVRICDTGAWAEQYFNSWKPYDSDAAGYYALSTSTSYGVGAYATVIFQQIDAGGTPPVPTCQTPVISISGGKATITCGTSGASIKYGFSETEITTSYSDPVAISEGQTIYARATCEGLEPSAVASKTCSSEIEYTITGNFSSYWGTAGDVMYAYVFDGSDGENWVLACYDENSFTFTFTTGLDFEKCIAVRMAAGTAVPSWEAMWNKSNDIIKTGTTMTATSFQ